ncbi:MAG: hypothetical protein LBJ32_04740 [Oscillospiraceae bacterium]|jgi:glucose-6-phosphate isomerase|nr:hypothetical protein [Oscillospiraceae bacterium]
MIFNNDYLKKIIPEPDYDNVQNLLIEIDKSIENRSCLGSEMLGCIDCLHSNINEEIKSAAIKIRSQTDIVLVIGIGGSYLGAKMAIEFLNPKNDFIIFLGNSMNAEPILDTIEKYKNKSIWVIVISKSGETLEINSALELIIEFMEKKYGSKANERITAVTGETGSLKNRAVEKKWEIFTIPDNIGGRFSVLSAAGLLPIAISGTNIDLLFEGAKKISHKLKIFDPKNNICFKYAASRICLYKLGYPVEILAVFDQRLNFFRNGGNSYLAKAKGKTVKEFFQLLRYFLQIYIL